jgi:hypothetical protein
MAAGLDEIPGADPACLTDDADEVSSATRQT